MITKYASLLVLGLLPFVAHAQNCPCDDGTSEYSVDCDGDGVNDACSVEDCGPCEAGNPPSDGKACCANEEYSTSYPPVTNNTSWTMDDALIGKFESIINSMPGPTIEVREVKAGGSGASKDCCKDENIIAGGIGYAEGTGKLEGELSDVTIWANPTIEKEFSFGALGSGEVMFKAGVYGEADMVVSGTFGTRYNNCDQETCNYGSLSLGTELKLKATVEAIVCVDTPWTEEQCADIEITPAEVTLTISGGVSTGDKDGCTDLTGTASLGKIEISAKFKLLHWDQEWSYEVFEGFSG